MAKVTGAAKHLRRMQRMGPAVEREASSLVYTLADMHATEAALSITAGSVSGAAHVPSQPHEPPNADTSVLDRSIHVESAGQFKALSVADVLYALALEFGTVKHDGSPKIIERPYMRPAAKKVRKNIDKLADAAVRRIVNGAA